MNWMKLYKMSRKPARQFTALALSALLTVLFGCSSASLSSGTGGGGGGGNGSSNVATITVDGGPEAGTDYSYPNGAFTSVTICVPGSTTKCQTIGGILVDTGSYGLRIEASALTLTLPQQTDSSSNPIVECGEFGSGFTWGPVQTADFTITGESANSMPIQVMGAANFPDGDAPGACTDNGADVGTSYDLDSVETLGANGILGVGNFAQDCGTACTQVATNPYVYYSCPSANACNLAAEPLASQVVNPVALFSTDNNGVVVQFPSLSGSAATLTGSLIFGIGTENNNGLGSATVYDVDTSYGNFSVEFDGQTYSDVAFTDTGSELFFFLDSAVTGLAPCPDAGYTSLYCPSGGTANLSATNEGFSNGNTGQVAFTIGDFESLTNTSDNAITMLGGEGIASDNSLYFAWGLPFFYGRTVITAIDGANTPAGPGPYIAY